MKKYLRTMVAVVVLLVFAAATVVAYMSPEYVRARDQLEYLNSSNGRFAVKVEENINKLYDRTDTAESTEWNNKVKRAEKAVQEGQTLCYILGGATLLSLGGAVVMFVQDRKKTATV